MNELLEMGARAQSRQGKETVVRACFRRMIALCACSMTVACAVGPDFVKPSPPTVSRYTREPLEAATASAAIHGGEAQRFTDGRDIPAEWWTLFRSKELNSLVAEAIRANPDLKTAEAALRVAQESANAQRGALFPTITGNFSPSRQKTPTSISPTPSSGATIYSLFTASVSVTYALDVFGGTRRQLESAEAAAEAQRFQLEAAWLSLTSNVVTAALQEASLRAQIEATKRIVQIQKQTLDLLRRQERLGQVPTADVVAQEAALAQVEATLPPLLKQLAQQRNLLTALVGRFPNDEPSERFELTKLTLPHELPVSLPSKLVEQRPDIRAAEANLHSASAQVGVAVANMLPQINLTGNIGSTALKLGQLFTPGLGYWTVAASLAQPVLDGGTLLSKKRGADAAFAQAAAQYQSTVVGGFRNVADVLRALQYDAEALKAQVAAEQAAARSLEIARRRVALGDVTYLALLNAEQTYQQALINRVQAQAARYADTAALFLALGGGWWNRDEATGIQQIPRSHYVSRERRARSHH